MPILPFFCIKMNTYHPLNNQICSFSFSKYSGLSLKYRINPKELKLNLKQSIPLLNPTCNEKIVKFASTRTDSNSECQIEFG